MDKQGVAGQRGLTPADFVVSVAGQQRRIVTAEFVDSEIAPVSPLPQTEGAAISTNAGAGTGRLFAFIVDQNTLDLGSARRVSQSATTPFFSRLTVFGSDGVDADARRPQYLVYLGARSGATGTPRRSPA